MSMQRISWRGVNDMAGGRLKLELLAAGSVAKAFEYRTPFSRARSTAAMACALTGMASTRRFRCLELLPPGAGAPIRCYRGGRLPGVEYRGNGRDAPPADIVPWVRPGL